MKNKILTIILCIALILLTYLGYLVGYYNGVSEALIFQNMLKASDDFYTIKYIENNQLIKALEINKIALETDRATIQDISNNQSNLVKMPSRLYLYRDLLGTDYMKNYKILENNIESYCSQKKGKSAIKCSPNSVDATHN